MRERFPDIDGIIQRLKEEGARITREWARQNERAPNNPYPRGSEVGDLLDRAWRLKRDRVDGHDDA